MPTFVQPASYPGQFAPSELPEEAWSRKRERIFPTSFTGDVAAENRQGRLGTRLQNNVAKVVAKQTQNMARFACVQTFPLSQEKLLLPTAGQRERRRWVRG